MGKSFIEDKSEYTNLLLIDGLNLAFRYKYANKKEFASDYIRTVQSLAASYKACKVIILGDGGSTYRKALSPEYKANREEMRAKQTPEEEEQFREFLDEFNKTFTMLENIFECLRFYGVEADDIAGYLAKKYHKNFKHTWLISSDKDWDLLIKPDVSRFSYVTRKEITLDNWDTHYDYPQEDHISIKVLMGDKGDNVAGIAGVGPVRAKALIESYGSAYDILDMLPLTGKAKYIQNLNEFGDKINLNYELMDLETYCEEAIGAENLIIVDEVMKSNVN